MSRRWRNLNGLFCDRCPSILRRNEHYVLICISGEQAIKNNHLKMSQNQKGSSEPYSGPQIAKNLLPNQKIYHTTKDIPILLLQCESSGNPKPTITWYKVCSHFQIAQISFNPMLANHAKLEFT